MNSNSSACLKFFLVNNSKDDVQNCNTYRMIQRHCSYRLGRLPFIYSEKATKFYKIFTLLLNVCTVVKVKISQNFVAFSEYMNFTKQVSSGSNI